MIGEELLVCSHCGVSDSLTRLLNKPYVTKKKESSNNTGDVTKKFIEENRKILEQQKKEIKEKAYDES
jgi:RNA polymerase-binding transcription factor DksA